MTKIGNHRTIIEHLQESIFNTRISKVPLSIAIFDIDDFKSVNDTKGHVLGDHVLVDVATTIKRSIRDTDFAGRYGGEEFMVIFSNTDLITASKIAERIRKSIEDNHYADGINVTNSGGVKQYMGEDLKVFVQYRDIMKPYDPVIGRKYTITHSDTTGELFVFVATNYAEDQITVMRDEVRVAWKQYKNGLALIGSVIVSGNGVAGNANIRNGIFYKEMPTALQALRQADRFLFDKEPKLDNTPVLIHFISSNPAYDMIYDFGDIGNYKYT